MGSPVSVLVANLVIEDLEIKALSTYPGAQECIAGLLTTRCQLYRN